MTRVALVTAASARHLDEDLAPLGRALEAEGVTADVVVWDDPAVDWQAYDLVVVRSTWDYVPRRGELVAWAERVGGLTALANPPGLLRWSTDKRYLVDLAEAGVPVVPTVYYEPGSAAVLPDATALGDLDGDVVVKPAVGAGSVDAGRFGPHERADAEAHLGELLAEGRAALVQPYLPAIDDQGETALVYVAGRFSHAIRKAPILAGPTEMVEGLYAAERIEARQPRDAELAVGEMALAAVPQASGIGEPPLYARVDLVPGPDGRPLVLELELAEPSLFLDHGPGAAERLAAAIVTWVPHQ